MKKGFTLVELLIVVVIVGVLAAIAIPGYSKAVKKNGASRAVTYLQAIRLSEKMYYVKWAAYVPSNSDAIKATLGAETNANDYTFSITAPTTTGFIARARKGTSPSTDPTCTTEADTICIDQAGIWSGTSSYTPANPT